LLTIRPYRPADRAQLRAVAYATGYMGEPPAWYWRDVPSFVEIWSAWYTDHEPESAFVAADGDRVLGYLVGCVDTARAESPRDAVLRQLRERKLLFRPGTAGFFWRSIWDVLRDPGTPSGELRDPRWPSHLHINLLPAARGRGAGRGLMDAWFARLRAQGSPGCHLGTLAENTNAIAFFERVGFVRHGGPQLVPGMRLRESGARMHVQLMVRSA
jgi:ribosomal protein S18 acetylase RimI-like enzyme